MAFIDLDEFLFPVTAPSLAAALKPYEDCCCVCVPWFMFGFSAHDTPPKGLVIENYTHRAPFPPPATQDKLLKWKSIVQPSAVVCVAGVHMFDLASGTTGGVDERKVPVTRRGVAQQPPTGAVLRINHYFTRSRQEFATKLTRHHQGIYSQKDHRKRQLMVDIIEADTVHDQTILRFLPALRERIGR